MKASAPSSLYGRDAYLPGEINLSVPKTDIPAAEPKSEFARQLHERLRSTIQWTRECLDERRAKSLQDSYPNALIPVFRPKDIVYLREYKKHQEFGAFVRRYNGPFIVIRRIGQVNYLIEPHYTDPANKPPTTGQKIVHVDDLRIGSREPSHPQFDPSVESNPTELPSISLEKEEKKDDDPSSDVDMTEAEPKTL